MRVGRGLPWCWFPSRQFEFRRTRGGREGCVQWSFWGRGGARGFSCRGLAAAWADLQGRLRRALRSAAVVRHFHARAARVVFWWSQRPILGSPNLDPVLTSTFEHQTVSAVCKSETWRVVTLQPSRNAGQRFESLLRLVLRWIHCNCVAGSLKT